MRKPLEYEHSLKLKVKYSSLLFAGARREHSIVSPLLQTSRGLYIFTLFFTAVQFIIKSG